MKVFISWSGAKSLNIAGRLSEWLPYIIQPLKPFVSSTDIRKGARWSDVLAQELENSKYGIVCITRQNIRSSWLNFEAGALSKKTGHACVSPVLFGVERERLDGPLSQFQSTVFDKHDEKGEEFFGLISSINDILPDELRVPPTILKKTFDQWWPELSKQVWAAVNTETDETDTGFRWLYSMADLAATERQAECESVWVIDPEPAGNWHWFGETVQKNVAEGIEYDFIVPSDQVNNLRDLLHELNHHACDSPGGIDLTKVSIRGLGQKRFRSKAATHYRIFHSKGDAPAHTRVFFGVPAGDGNFWAEANEPAASNFHLRFREMRDGAEPQPVCTLSEHRAGPDAATPSPRAEAKRESAGK